MAIKEVGVAALHLHEGDYITDNHRLVYVRLIEQDRVVGEEGSVANPTIVSLPASVIDLWHRVDFTPEDDGY